MTKDNRIVPSVAVIRHVFDDLATATVRFVWEGHDRVRFSMEETNDWRQSLEKSWYSEEDDCWLPKLVELRANLVFEDLNTHETTAIGFMFNGTRESAIIAFTVPLDKYNELRHAISWIHTQLSLCSEAEVEVREERDADTAEKYQAIRVWYDAVVTCENYNILVEREAQAVYWHEYERKQLIDWLAKNGYDYSSRHLTNDEKHTELSDLVAQLGRKESN